MGTLGCLVMTQVSVHMGRERHVGKKGNQCSRCHQNTGDKDSANLAMNQYVGKTLQNEGTGFAATT